MTNMASMAKAGYGNQRSAECKVDFREAMQNAQIDRTETCFKGFGFLHVDDLAEYMAQVDALCDETPW